MKIKLSKFYAYINSPGLQLIILNIREKGYPVSMEAKANIINSQGGIDVYSIELNGKIIWVSEKEFKENKFIERPITRKEIEEMGK